MCEVDHPATQSQKRRRIAAAGWEIPKHLHFLPIDFNQESLAGVLLRSSCDPQKLSFFSSSNTAPTPITPSSTSI